MKVVLISKSNNISILPLLLQVNFTQT